MGAGNSTNEIPYSVQEKVPEITKRTIGKLIVKYCGNEGQADDPTLYVTLRQMLQATITKLDTETPETWKNAEIVIYDQHGNDFCVRSGEAENKFVVQLDEKDEINIMCTDRKRKSTFGWIKSTFKFPDSFFNGPTAAIDNGDASPCRHSADVEVENKSSNSGTTEQLKTD